MNEHIAGGTHPGVSWPDELSLRSGGCQRSPEGTPGGRWRRGGWTGGYSRTIDNRCIELVDSILAIFVILD